MAKRIARRAAGLLDHGSPMSKDEILQGLMKLRGETLSAINRVITQVRRARPKRKARMKRTRKRR